MKKQLIAITMACALLMSSNITAFAGSSSDSGLTSGGVDYNDQKTSTSASLNVTKSSGTARTSAGTTDNISLSTSIVYYYVNGSGHRAASSGNGSSRADAGCNNSKGTDATSQHTVSGGRVWGNWSCSLSASA